MAGGRTSTRLSLDTGAPILPRPAVLVETGDHDGATGRARRVAGPGGGTQSSGVIGPKPVPSRIGAANPVPVQRYR